MTLPQAVHTPAGTRPPGVPGVPKRLATWAARQPDAPCLTVLADDGSDITYSYAELADRVARFAGWLLREPDGTPVALLAVNDAPSAVALLGALHARRPMLVLNPADPPARLRDQARALGVKLILRSPHERADALPEAQVLPEHPAAAPAPLPAQPDLWTDAFYFGTSGSTATAKLVAQLAVNAAANAEAVRRHHALGPGVRLLGCLPIHHVNGVHFTLLATVFSGAHAILTAGFDPLGYARVVGRYRPHIASVVPAILEALTEVWRGPPPPAELAYFVSAAAPLSARTARAVHDRLGRRVLQGYGLTETTNFSATVPRGLSDAAYRRLVLDAEIPSIGVAVHGNEVAVLGPDGAPVAPGAVGEVCIRGHNVMRAYAGNAEATAEAFRHGWFHSQDLGFERLDPEAGRALVLTGRTKNIAKVRGESVSLEEMEHVLRAVPGVRDAACVITDDRFLGDAIVAAVVLGPGIEAVDLDAHLGRRFARAVFPTRVVRLDVIPRTPTGKVLRAQLAGQVD